MVDSDLQLLQPIPAKRSMGLRRSQVRHRWQRRVAALFALWLSGPLIATDAVTADHVICLRTPASPTEHYLIASYHAPMTFPVMLGPRVRAAVERSDEVVFEALLGQVPDEPAELDRASVLIRQLDPPLPEDLDRQIDNVLHSTYQGLAANWRDGPAVDVFTVLGMAATMVHAKETATVIRRHTSLDQEIQRIAIEGRRRIGSLETPVEQRRSLRTVPSSVWIAALRMQISRMSCKSCVQQDLDLQERSVRKMLAGDFEGLSSELRASIDASFSRTGFALREPVLVASMLERIADDRPRLYVLGGAHIVGMDGSTGVLPGLRKAGVIVDAGCSPR